MRRFMTFFTKKGNVDYINITKVDKILIGNKGNDFKVYLTSRLMPTTYPIRNNEKTLEIIGLKRNDRDNFDEQEYKNPWSGRQ